MNDTQARSPIGRMLGLAMVVGLTGGCGSVADIDHTYGVRSGTPGETSVNGTASFAKMFVERGHRVSSIDRLSPRVHQSQVIVWVPNDFEPPSAAARDYLEDWLALGEDRTVIYVGREYDAAPWYWSKALAQAPADQFLETWRRASQARADFDSQMGAVPLREDCGWFVRHRDRPTQRPATLQGPWSQGVDATKIDIELPVRLEYPVPPTDTPEVPQTVDEQGRRYEMLLASDDLPLIFRITAPAWSGGQILVVANGSLVLNGPLSNFEHRKVASQMVAASSSTGRVLFLESGSGGPTISHQASGTKQATGFEILTTWPLGAVLMHLLALGILAAGVFFPIFGRPRTSTPDAPGSDKAHADFSRHLEALAELMESRGDAAYAANQVATYRQKHRVRPL